MYFEEKMIDGILHYRTAPEGKFRPYELKELSQRYVQIQKEYNEIIMSVASKYPLESRHQTALRYVHEAEMMKGLRQATGKRYSHTPDCDPANYGCGPDCPIEISG